MRLKIMLTLMPLLMLNFTVARADETNAGTIHFTGEIVNPSCKIAGDSGTDSTVYLGSYSPSYFTGGVTKSDDTPFTITLTGCPLATTGLDHVQLTFKGTVISEHDELLALIAGGASGVGISVSTETAPTVDLDMTGKDGQTSIPLPSTASDINLNMLARYESYDSTPITPGDAKADMTVNILYR